VTGEQQLELKKLRRSTLPVVYVVDDMIGSQLLERLETPGGHLLRLATV
jgi:hypothetical protein